MKKKIGVNKSDTEQKDQDADNESVDSNHEVIQSPVNTASILDLQTTNPSDEESDNESHDINQELFKSLEPKSKSTDRDHDEKFSLYFDDSSSEEDENEAEYDIITSFQDFPRTSEAYKSAFYSHALGIQLLRAPLVKKIYYEEKAKHLKYEDEILDSQAIKDWIREHIKKNIIEVCFYLPGKNARTSELLAEEFLAQHEGIISQLIDAIIIDKNLLFSSFNKKTDLLKLFKDADKLLPTLYDNIINFISEFNFKDIKFANADDFLVGKVERDEQYQELRNRIIDFLNSDIDDCMSKFTYTKTKRVASNEKAKSNSKEKLKKLPDSPSKQAAIKYIKNAAGAKSPDTVRQDISTRALHNALKQLKDNIEDDETSSLFDEVQDALVNNGLVALTEDEISAIIESNIENEDFLSYLFDSLQESKKSFYRENGIERIILPEGHIFDLSDEDNFLPKFLATLNICNRSARRHLRNNDDDELERLIEEEYHRAWKFPQTERLATDNHKFTTTGKRNDETSELGAYSTVLKLINVIKEQLNKYRKEGAPKVKNKDIAFWIRKILQGDKLDVLLNYDGKNIEIEHYTRLIKMVKFDLVKITYLLFGSEVVRNPASLIHQQMMLDLIMIEKLSWQEALDSEVTDKDKSDGGEMPMSMKKAVASSRILHNEFLKLMPQAYMYDPAPTEPSAREAELLQREHNIIKKWFDNYVERSYLNQKDEDLKSIDKAKIEILVEQIVRWYGIHLLWYTGDQINQLLNFYLGGSEQIVIRPSIPLIESDILTTTINESVAFLAEERSQAAVIPLNIGNNHWVSLILRFEGNALRAIYNDPLGNQLSDYNREIITNAIEDAILEHDFFRQSSVIDLRLEQQTNGYDCGPITVNNLVRLALAENIDYDNEATISQTTNLISYDNQDSNLRQRHSEFFSMARDLEGEIMPTHIGRLEELLTEERRELSPQAAVDRIVNPQPPAVEEPLENLGNITQALEQAANESDEKEESASEEDDSSSDNSSNSTVNALYNINYGNLDFLNHRKIDEPYQLSVDEKYLIDSFVVDSNEYNYSTEQKIVILPPEINDFTLEDMSIVLGKMLNYFSQ